VVFFYGGVHICWSVRVPLRSLRILRAINREVSCRYNLLQKAALVAPVYFYVFLLSVTFVAPHLVLPTTPFEIHTHSFSFCPIVGLAQLIHEVPSLQAVPCEARCSLTRAIPPNRFGDWRRLPSGGQGARLGGPGGVTATQCALLGI
jgi:hypothetical protein